MHQSTRTWRVFAALLAGLVIVAATTLVSAAPAEARVNKLTHRQAAKMLRNGHITWSSSGGCSNRYNPTCTSFSKIRHATIRGIKVFKLASNCRVNITGGTETGHASGTYSHWNGYKVDISRNRCVDRYITRNYRSIGGSKWRSGRGNVYYNEGDHWDILYYNCGCD